MDSFMNFQQKAGSAGLSIGKWVVLFTFGIAGIVCFIIAFNKVSIDCFDDSDCDGHGTCVNKAVVSVDVDPSDDQTDDPSVTTQGGIGVCSKKRKLYWMIGVAVGIWLFGGLLFWGMGKASKSKTLSQLAAFGGEADMLKSVL